MLKNYFITAIRSLLKDILYTITNLVGLAIGIACCILILIFVHNELSFDKFHSNSDTIYRAWVKEDYKNGNQFFNTVTPYPLGPALEAEIPEIDHVVQISNLNWKLINGSKKNPVNVKMVGKDFFKVFDFPAIAGKPDEAMQDATSIILSEKAARNYFGGTDIIGKTLSFDLDDEQKIFSVKAVVKDPPPNSSIKFEILISDLNKSWLLSPIDTDNWFNINPETYVLLNSETKNLVTLDPKFKTISEKYVRMQEEGTFTIGLQRLDDIHLNPDYPIGNVPVTDPKYAYILGGIAILILFLACINFVLLSISKSVGRAKEVGVRKSIGAYRHQIIQQFLSEAILTVFISLCVALILVKICIPFFNDIANKELELTLSPFILIVALSMIIVIGLLAGSYPALVVSNFKPASILKGGNTGISGKSSLRKILVGVQFVLSLGLIASTIIMTQQLKFLQNKNLGFDKEQLVTVQLPESQGRMISLINDGMEKAKLFKTKLNNQNEISGVAASAHTFSAEGWTEIGFSDSNGIYKEFNLNVVSSDYIPTMAMEIVEGRNFQEDNASDEKRAVIINEAFAKEYKITTLNGAKISDSRFGDHEIIGIVKDFNYSSLHGDIKPLAMTYNPSLFFGPNININVFSNPAPKLFLRLKSNEFTTGIETIKKSWLDIVGDEPFEYQFVDEQLNAMYEQERNLGHIVGIAAILAIFVGGLGLFALASLNIQNRMKELSIRKVLGASNGDTLFLISKEYIIMIVVTLVIATPITWYIMDDWLSSFTYKIDITIMFFIMAGLVATITAAISISYHAYKAMRTQPIEYLHYE